MAKDRTKKTESKSTLKDYIISIVAAIAIALVFRTYVFARADVEGQSMYSTLNDKDVIFVEKLSVLTHSIKKGEIIIFDSKNAENDIYVKRVVATAGDEIEIKDGRLYVNGSPLKEDYLDPGTITNPGPFFSTTQKYTVQKNYVFVLGDNRGNSVDSRMLGPINISDIKGHAIVRVYPFSKLRFF
jgi:signal peptidase I